MDKQTTARANRTGRVVLILALSAAIPASGFAQSTDSLDFRSKVRFHAASVSSPLSLAGGVDATHLSLWLRMARSLTTSLVSNPLLMRGGIRRVIRSAGDVSTEGADAR